VYERPPVAAPAKATRTNNALSDTVVGPSVSRYRNALLFFTLAALWGGSFVAIEIGLEFYPPVLYAAYRFDFAAVILVSYVLLTRDAPLPTTRADLLAIVLAGGFTVAANNSLLFVGQQYTTSGIAAVTYSLVPIVTAAVAGLISQGSGLDARGALGVILGLVGVALVAQPDPQNLAGGVTIGVALVFLGVIAVSIGSVGLRELETTFSSIETTAWAMLAGGFFMHLFSLGLAEPQKLPVTEPMAIIALGFLSVFASAAAYSIYFTLLDRVGAFQINLVSYVVPVVATVAGWALLGEAVTVYTIVGFCIIVVGFVLLKRAAIRRELPKVRGAIGNWF